MKAYLQPRLEPVGEEQRFAGGRRPPFAFTVSGTGSRSDLVVPVQRSRQLFGSAKVRLERKMCTEKQRRGSDRVDYVDQVVAREGRLGRNGLRDG